MSRVLCRLGSFCYSHRWRVISGWAVVLVAVATLLVTGDVKLSGEVQIEGTPSQQMLDLLAEEIPEAAGGQATVVYQAPDGGRLDSPSRAEAIVAAEARVRQNPHVLAAQGDGSSVMMSPDGSVALFQFQLDVPVMDLEAEAAAGIVDAAAAGDEITTLAGESLQPMPSLFGPGELIGVVVAALVLLVTLGSLRVAGLPLLTALVGVGIGVGTAFTLSKVVGLMSISAALALMIGIAVGIDYALFIVNRQQRLILDRGLSAREAASRAIGTAGSAVFFAGLTVIAVLSALTIMGISFLTTMAVVAVFTVLVAVAIALTLLPAILGLLGEKIVPDKARRASSASVERPRRRFAPFAAAQLLRWRWLVVVLVLAALGSLAIPMAQMRLAMPDGATANLDTAARRSYDAISAGFGEGFNSPLLVVAQSSDGVAVPGATVMAIQERLGELDGVVVAAPGPQNEAATVVTFAVIPVGGPGDESTRDLVGRLRGGALDGAVGQDVAIGVTGASAVNIDISDRMAEAFPMYLVIIAAISLLILLIVFRSVLLPVLATVGYIFAVLATFGATTAVFQWGWLGGLLGIDTGGPVQNFLPILVAGVLYGLAMDYQVFLGTSMREAHVHGLRGRDAIVRGFTDASRVVVGAAVIMACVFAGFVFGDDLRIRQIGLALAVGIVLDTFLIRLALLPALMSMFADAVWWLPRWLDRLVPDLDIEGDKLPRSGLVPADGPRKDTPL
jgi:RND superfamily putative drug exporter